MKQDFVDELMQDDYAAQIFLEKFLFYELLANLVGELKRL